MSDHPDSRPPVDPAAVQAALERLPGWRVEVLEQAESTNAEVARRFQEGADEGLVIVGEHQTHGRGRLGREWVTPARSSLTASFLLAPDTPPERWPWLSLMAGIASATAVRRVTGVQANLKWPNDVLAGGQKLGGILLERVERSGGGPGAAAAVVGIGINCSQTADELPVPEATSLALVSGGDVDRTTLLSALVEDLAEEYDAWRGGADLRPRYLDLCVTPGMQVRVTVPNGEVAGEAVDVDESGRLVVRTASGEEHLGAGDVVHVRPEG